MNLPFGHDHTTKKLHVWHCTFVLPKDEVNKWNRNMNLAVAGEDIQTAVDTIIAKYPEAKIYGISHGAMLMLTEAP